MKKISFKNNDNKKIFGTLSIPNKKSSEMNIIVHGFSTTKDGGSKITAKILTKNKINNLTIDLDDIGESEPAFEDMTITKYAKTIISTIKYLEKKGFKHINIIGTSTGALSTMVAALKYPKINSIILRSASPYDGEWFKKHVGGSKGLDRWKKKGFIPYKTTRGIKKIKYGYYTDALKYNMYKLAKNIKVPTTLIHGRNDNNIPYKNAKKLARNFSKAKFITINGADHTLGVNGDYKESQNIILNCIWKVRK